MFLKKAVSIILLTTFICGTSSTDCGALPENSVIAGDDCYKYFQCINGVIEDMQCNPYYKFNPASGKCEYSPDCLQGDVKPGDEIPCAATTGVKEGDFKPSKISCKYFYFCHKGLSILQYCPDGWGFVEKDQLCVKDHKCI